MLNFQSRWVINSKSSYGTMIAISYSEADLLWYIMQNKILIYFFFLVNIGLLQAQTERHTLDISLTGGVTKYWGEFTDDRLGAGGSIGLRYNIFPELFVNGAFGIGRTEFGISQAHISKFPSYYGAGAIIGQSRYPNTSTLIEETNSLRLNTYEFMLGARPLPSEPLSPYIFFGIGLLDWNITNSKEHSPLPNNANSVYDRQSVCFPAGIGFDIYITERLSFQANASYRFTPTDWLDDMKVADSRDDGFATFGAGISYSLFINKDRDDDGLKNEHEEKIGTNPELADTDGDGLKDGTEIMLSHTNPLLPDTDGDGLSDGEETLTNPLKTDTDDDGLNDAIEKARGTDPLRADTDGDEITDADEVLRYGTDPLNNDTDDDGVRDGREIMKYASDPRAMDTDNDGINDGDEIYTTLTNVRSPDSDGDGLTDGAEYAKTKTDPLDTDTDRDGVNDYDEVMKYASDPLKKDTDLDGWTDAEEIHSCSSPTNPDSDGDGIIDSKDSSPCRCNSGNIGALPAQKPCPCEEKPQSPTKSDESSQKSSPDMTQNTQQKRRFDLDIRFKVNTDELDFSQPETAKNLEKLKEYINESCEDLRVVLEGHASSEGSEQRNRKLSELRSQRIQRWLMEEGVKQERILGTSGYGSTRPRSKEPAPKDEWRYSPDQIEELRKQNRRLTVRVEKDCA